MIGEVICEMIIPVLMGRIVDIGIGGSDMGYIVRTGLIMLGVALMGLAFGILGGVFGAKASAGFARNLRKSMYDNIQTFSFASIDKFSSSSLVTRLTTDVTNIQNAYQMILRMAMRAPASMIIAMVMSFIISPELARIYLGAVVFLAIVMSIVMRRATRYFQPVFRRYDDLNNSVQENVSSIRVVKAYVREDYEIDKFHKAASNIYDMFIKAEMNVVVVSPIMMSVVYGCILLISWFGAHLIVTDRLGTGELMSLLAYCMNILMSLMMLSMVFIMITMSQASAKRIVEVINEKSDLTNPENPIMEVPDGSIRFEDVDFSYRQGTGEPVLKDINLDIKSGESIGIIGGTGSAKSSLVNLISRLYDVTQGRVVVGENDVQGVAALVGQGEGLGGEVHIFVRQHGVRGQHNHAARAVGAGAVDIGGLRLHREGDQRPLDGRHRVLVREGGHLVDRVVEHVLFLSRPVPEARPHLEHFGGQELLRRADVLDVVRGDPGHQDGQ